MAFLNTKERYGSISIALHWLMLLLFIAVYTFAELRGYFPKGSDMRKDLMSWHYFFGISIFILVVVRLAVRLINHFWASEPAIVPDVSAWEKWLAKLMHFALYLLMIFMPVAGYLGLSAAGYDVSYLGITLPNLMELDKVLGKSILNLHETVGDIGYFLIGAHALAALFHHYIRRDNTLKRMWFKQD